MRGDIKSPVIGKWGTVKVIFIGGPTPQSRLATRGRGEQAVLASKLVEFTEQSTGGKLPLQMK